MGCASPWIVVFNRGRRERRTGMSFRNSVEASMSPFVVSLPELGERKAPRPRSARELRVSNRTGVAPSSQQRMTATRIQASSTSQWPYPRLGTTVAEWRHARGPSDRHDGPSLGITGQRTALVKPTLLTAACSCPYAPATWRKRDTHALQLEPLCWIRSSDGSASRSGRIQPGQPTSRRCSAPTS